MGAPDDDFDDSAVQELQAAGLEVGWVVVNEAGASVYSASELASKELQGMDVSLRGAVSIARRLQVGRWLARRDNVGSWSVLSLIEQKFNGQGKSSTACLLACWDHRAINNQACSLAGQDPLSELVKIEPHHIGVGLYQHDLKEKRLAQELDAVVEMAVNSVGVDVNVASPALLTRVAGLGPALAKRMVEHRDQSGAYKDRVSPNPQARR